MKNFYITIYTIITLFLLVMSTVVAITFKRKSNSTGIDPARIKQLREIVRK